MDERKTISLRVSAHLHGRLVEATRRSGRTLTGEIVSRLTETLDRDAPQDSLGPSEIPAIKDAVRNALVALLGEDPDLAQRVAQASIAVRREDEPHQPANQKAPAGDKAKGG